MNIELGILLPKYAGRPALRAGLRVGKDVVGTGLEGEVLAAGGLTGEVLVDGDLAGEVIVSGELAGECLVAENTEDIGRLELQQF